MTTITSLRTEYLVDPLGIDEREPRLSWRMETPRRGARQTAYRIRVAGSASGLAAGDADRWDSGRVESDQTTHVAYAGAPLGSRDACHWQVEVWDDTGASVVSEPARWTMGLLEPGDWQAEWIAADPEVIARDPEAIEGTATEPGTAAMFRREFSAPAEVVRATVHASARGLFELSINGERVGEDLLAPEWTDYDRRIHYRTYEVTDLLREGANAIGALLGDGWWSGYVGWQETRGRYGSLENSLLVQLELETADGGREVIASDGSWRCEASPVLSSDFMMGETYDARREREGWDSPGFIESFWLPARTVDAPEVPLVAQRSEPVRVTERLTPVSRTRMADGSFIFDLGQNIAGWVHLQLEAPPGTRLTLRHAERLNPDGTLYTENLRRAKCTDVVIVGPSGRVDWQPRFTFHGFQFVELSGLEGLEGQPPDGAVTGCMVQSATPPAGHFECSSPDVNRLWLNGLWSQKDNFLSVPTDCPQRDERLGWMGDAQVFLRTATYNADVAAFFTKWMVDVEDAQTDEGIFPDTAPRLREGDNFVGLDDLCGGAAWADAGVIIPHTIWRVYGDCRIIRRHWKAMVAWLDYLEQANPGHLRVHELRNNYGDWLCIPSDREFRTHSPMKNLLATAYWAHDASLMARMARAIGRHEESRRFEAMFEQVRRAFRNEFVRPDGSLTVETQTAYLLALAFDLVPADLREAAAAHLVRNIRDLDWHLSTGFVGIRHLNPVLTECGHAEVAYRLLLQDSYPSWLYPVKHGATTIWERWNGWTEEGGFFDPLMNSFNHYSLGSVGEWLFRHVAGIELDPEVPGFKRFLLYPYPGEGLKHASGRYRSLHGEIGSRWQWDGRQFSWNVTIPPNTGATIAIPADPGSMPSINGKAADQPGEGLRYLGRDDTRVRLEAVAGTYAIDSSFRGFGG